MANEIVAYNGVCPLCGSRDGIVTEVGGRFRVMCRVMGCNAWYTPCPAEGYPKQEDTTNPFESDLLKDGTCDLGRYLTGKGGAIKEETK